MVSRLLIQVFIVLGLFCSFSSCLHIPVLSDLSTFRKILESSGRGGIFQSFGSDIKNILELEAFIKFPSLAPKSKKPTKPDGPEEWKKLFSTTELVLDDKCFQTKNSFYIRTYDGSCNWLQQNNSWIGAKSTLMWRDYSELNTTYSDGISKPREGPNERVVSNAFFQRRKRLTYEHTPVLVGFVEFLIHDIIYSKNSVDPEDIYSIPVPDDDPVFPKGSVIQMTRTEKLAGTGTNKTNVRENPNQASTWFDLSPVYGSDEVTAKKLRSYKNGKLLTQIGVDGREYLPFNTMGVETNTLFPGQDPTTLFAGGDPRTNQDWLLLAWHTLFLREHNRLCDILMTQYPDWDDEQLYQAARHLTIAKYTVMLLQYATSYFTKELNEISPPSDGLGIFRVAHNASFTEINSFHKYPWKYSFQPPNPQDPQAHIFVASHEMSLGYRFHDFITPTFNLTDARYRPYKSISIAGTQMDAKGFLQTPLSDIIRGMANTTIPNFHSGVDESFRSAQWGKGRYFDLAALSVFHERERGLPTFNMYFRELNKYYKRNVKIREKFEDFTPVKEYQDKLKELYKTPDDVDLTVGVELDENLFPGTTIPESALISSLIGIMGVGSTDRFGMQTLLFRCLLVDTPWDCHPSNILEELLWESKPKPGYPNFRWLSSFWLKELGLISGGMNQFDSFWRLVHDNTDIQCLTKNSYFPENYTNPNDVTYNPMVCSEFPFQLTTSILENTGDYIALFKQIGIYGFEWGIGIGIVIGFIIAKFAWKITQPAV